jgi:hypothetical protein
MQMIRVEKYIDGICQEQFSVPVSLVRFLAGLLPVSARWRLRLKGIDLDAMVTASRGAPAAIQWIDVTEKGVAKRIRLTTSAK